MKYGKTLAYIKKSLGLILLCFIATSSIAAEETLAGSGTEDEYNIIANQTENCDSDVLKVGIAICPRNKLVNMSVQMMGRTVIHMPTLEAVGYNDSHLPPADESSITDFFSYMNSAFDYIIFISLGIIALLAVIYLIFKYGEKDFKHMKRERSFKLTLNTLYTLIIAFAWNRISTIFFAASVLITGGILSLFFYLITTKNSEEVKLEENENSINATAMSTNLMAVSRSVLQTKVPMFQLNLSKASDMKLSDALEEFDDDYKVEWTNVKVSKTNFDFTYKIWNLMNSYEFVSIINYGFKKPEVKGVFSPLKMETSIGTYLADNTVFTDIDGSLKGDSVNDGLLLKSLYLATLEASQFPVTATANAYMNVIKSDLKSNSYSEMNEYDGVAQPVYEFAKNVSATVVSDIKSETSDSSDVTSLISSSFKKLADSALGNNLNMTISEFVKFSDETARLEKLSFCSKNYDEYNSARASIGKLNYSETIGDNLRRNAFAFNSCIEVSRNAITVVGFDASKDKAQMLDLEQTIEARKLAIERVRKVVPTAFQHAADIAMNVDADKGNSVIQKSDAQLAKKAVDGGVFEAGLRISDMLNSYIDRMKSRQAFTSTNVFMYNSEINPDSDYIIGDAIYKTSIENGKSESEKSLRENYVNPFSEYSYTKFDKADFNDLNSIESSTNTGKGLTDVIYDMIFDFKAIQLAMGLSTNDSFPDAVKKCNESKVCTGGKLSVSQFLSMMGMAGFNASMKVIVLNEVVKTLKNLVDNVADVVESSAGASTSAKGFNLKSMVAGAKMFLGGASKALLMVASAGLEALSALAWPLVPICLFLWILPPLIPFFLFAFLGFRFLAFFFFFTLTGKYILLSKFWKNDFNLFAHVGSVFANFMRLPVGTFFICMIMIFDQYLPFGSFLMPLAGILVNSPLGIVSFIIVTAVIMSYVAKWLFTSVEDMTNAVVVKMGGDRNEFGIGIAEVGVLIAKVSSMTVAMKHVVAEQAQKFRGTKTKAAEESEPVKFKDAPKA